MPSQTVRMTVHFVHGEPFTVEADADDARLRNMAGSIEQAMSANYVGVEVEGTLHLLLRVHPGVDVVLHARPS